ncbi:hypothetical protein J2Z22_000933 [Paenibacillus forsythiae]|uniref:Uncharacterized protein n=1 Tax=Paenibacillus forsythiae TaxID=365616 RepID=A0ABU3H5S5_9BACL|nr:hypothetical protein [Paenibacillus forsythiae]
MCTSLTLQDQGDEAALFGLKLSVLVDGQKVQAFQIQTLHTSRIPEFMQVLEAVLAEWETKWRKKLYLRRCVLQGRCSHGQKMHNFRLSSCRLITQSHRGTWIPGIMDCPPYPPDSHLNKKKRLTASLKDASKCSVLTVIHTHPMLSLSQL